MVPFRAVTGAAVFASVLAGVAPSSDSAVAVSIHSRTEAAPCVRPRPRAWRDGESITITGDAPAPCRLVFRDTSIVLLSDATNVPVLGSRVVRDQRGRFYTYSRSQIAVWSPEGRFMRTFGALGQGPGEFAGGALTILPAPNNELYILDNSRRLTVVDSGYKLVRTLPSNIGLGSGVSVVTPAGDILDGARPVQSSALFDIKSARDTDAGGFPKVLRSIGEATPDEAAHPRSSRTRRITPAGASRFWSGPPAEIGRGYEVELWDVEGRRVRTIRRDAPWYPPGVDVRGQGRDAVPPSEVEALHYLGDGLLWILLMVPDREVWPKYLANRSDTTLAAKAARIYGEVIDTDAGVVLARTGPMSITAAMSTLPIDFFLNSRLGFRPFETASGESAFQIVAAHLESR